MRKDFNESIYIRHDFFKDDIISWLQEQKNRSLYVLMYLKLYMKTSENNRIIDTKSFNEIDKNISMEKEVVEESMKLFIDLGIVKEKNIGYVINFIEGISENIE